MSRRRCPCKGTGSGSALTPRGQAVSARAAGQRGAGATAAPCSPRHQLSLRLVRVTTGTPSATDGRRWGCWGARSGRPARGSRRRLLSPHQLLTQSVGFEQKETSDEPASPGHGPCPPKHRGAEGAERGRRRYLDNSVAARQLVTATPPPRSDRPLPAPEGALPRLTGPTGKRGREPPHTPVSPSENSGGHGAQRARFCETAGSL